MSTFALQIAATPHEYFRGKITEASKQLNIKIELNVEFYLVNLLASFVGMPGDPGEAGSDRVSFDTPLALLYKQALEAPGEKRQLLLRQLGDNSLYISGFFQDYFNDKAFDIGYFMDMGANAYGQASTLYRNPARDDALPDTLDNLAKNFSKFVEVVAQASESTVIGRDSGLLNIYERWNKSGSARLRSILEERGITPIKFPTKIAQ